MKKIISVILVAALAFGALSLSSKSLDKEEFKAKAELVFENFVNVLIDVIHRGITVIRYPWTPKSDNKIDLDKFDLVFEDEFEGDRLNENIWRHTRPGMRKGGFWDSEQCTLSDGFLHIAVEHKQDGKYGEGYYCDRIDTRKTYLQKYGYFECRCKLPAAQGIWSAFWLSSENVNDYVPGTQGTEIDVFESPLWYRGLTGRENGLVTQNLHYGGYNFGHRYRNVAVAKANDPYNEFNNYGVEWNSEGYVFYVNGVETGRSDFGGVSEVPEYMQLSIEVDGAGGKPSHGWSGKITRNKEGILPAELVVDYVRAYQYK